MADLDDGTSDLDDVLGVVLTVARAAHDHDIKYPAAALAYYAFVSFLPLLVLVVAVVGETYTVEIRRAIPRFLTPEARQLVSESITTASGRVAATLLAVVVLAWSAANTAVDFQTVVERVEGRAEGSLPEQLRDASAILGAFVLVLLSMILVGAALALVPPDSLVTDGWPLLLFVVLTVAFLPLYYLPSRVVTSLIDALPGAVTAAVGWTLLLAVIRFYAENATQYAIYGVLSGVIIILTSLYLGAMVLMIGVIVNVTLSGRDPQPE